MPPTAHMLKSDRAREEIRTWIDTGQYAAGDRLPPERTLAERLGMNHITVRRGLADLVEEGLIVKRPKVGNFVSDATRVAQVAVVLPRHATFCQSSGALHPYYSRVVEGIHTVLDQQRYGVSSLVYDRGQLWQDVSQNLKQSTVRGILLGGDMDVTAEDARQIRQLGLPVVLIHRCPVLSALGLPLFGADVMRSLYEMIVRLAELGHRNIRILTHQVNSGYKKWHKTIESAIEASGLGDISSLQVDYPNTDQEETQGPLLLEQLLTERPRPTAIVTPDEFVAARLFRLCYRMNILIPDDLSIASPFNSAPEMHPVPLTSVHTAELARKAGVLAAKHIESLMEGRQIESRRVLLQGQVTWTDSIAPVSTPVDQS